MTNLIEFETAKLANEKGYIFNNSYDDGFYVLNKTKCSFDKTSYEVGQLEFNYIDETNYPIHDVVEINKLYVSTKSELQTWLRETFKIDVLVTMSEFSRTYGYKIFYIENGKTLCINNMYIKKDKYEVALEVGLFEGLKLIEL